jgi:hypothetical protein
MALNESKKITQTNETPTNSTNIASEIVRSRELNTNIVGEL